MDPFVAISFGKRCSFHVRKHETSYEAPLTVLDWDKLSSNVYIGDITLDIKELIKNAPQPDPHTGLYKADEDEGGGGKRGQGMTQFNLPL